MTHTIKQLKTNVMILSSDKICVFPIIEMKLNDIDNKAKLKSAVKVYGQMSTRKREL